MEIKDLENKIKKLQAAYYNDEALVSDEEFDALWDELRQKDPTNPLLTSEIGNDSADGFPKAKHTILMGSQDKVNTQEELEKWLAKFPETEEFTISKKCDGISIELNYVEGKLTSGITRGSGMIGDLVTPNVLKMKGVPTQITKYFTGAIRGEILLFRADKEKYFPEMKNCRNAASGLAKRLDGVGCEHLTVVSYDVLSLNDGILFAKDTEKLKFLEMQKFVVVDYYVESNHRKAAELITKKRDYLFGENYDELEYDIDGIVIKQNTIDEDDLTNNIRPKTQVAYKPARREFITKLENIEWQNTNGTMVPIAILAPIEIEGATIRKASLCNLNLLLELGVEIGDNVVVSRRNMIIPKVERKAF